MISSLQKEIKKESALKRNYEMVVEAKMPTNDFSKILPISRDCLPVLSKHSPDRFQDLRYDEALANRKIPELLVWDPMVSVLVKRPLAYQPPVEVAKPFTLGLQLPVDEKKQTLRLYEPFTRFTRRKVETLKRDKVQQPWCQNPLLRRELEKQEHALQAWKDSLQSSARTTAWISKKIGRPAAKLLLNTPLRLPPPKNHQDTSYGSEQVKHMERFYHSDAFFWMPQSVGPAEFSIDTSPTWTERKFYKPPLTIARPRLDDTLPTSSRDEKRYQDQERARAPLQKLLVKGAEARLRFPSLVTLSPDDNRGNIKKTRIKKISDGASSDIVHSRVCLMVEGNRYYWGEPCPQDLVEVGFVCVAGQRAYNEIRLANMGKTVIRCVWCKTVHSNHFNKGHYLTDHFIFDCSDRILLPLDRVTLKVQFHANYPGFWREVWHLKTEPALGSGNIPISLWARVLPVDNDCRLTELERQLEHLSIKRIVANYNDQLLRNLPHRDYDTIFPVAEDIFMMDDVKLFEQANPGLSYHGHAMFTIVKLYRKVRERRSSPNEVDLVEEVRNVILDKYPRIPQKEEESRKAGKTPKETTIYADTDGGGLKSEEVNPRRDRLSRKPELKKDVVQMPSISSMRHEGSRKTEVDELLEGNPADQNPLERRNITVEGLHKMIRVLDERLEEKNSMLMELNQAVRDMSFHRDQPNMPHFKHLVCRTALCQAADDVATIAHRLWHDMRLGVWTKSFRDVSSNDNVVEMVTADVEKRTLPNKRLINKGKRISKLDVSSNADQRRNFQHDATDNITFMTSVQETAPAEPEVSRSREMYREVLFVMVYERVKRLLLDLLPLMTCDEPQLNPLKPRPEL